MEYPTGNQYLDLFAWETDYTPEWKQNTVEQTNNYQYRLFGFPWRKAQLVIVHVLLDCSIAPQNRKNQDILVTNLNQHPTPDPTWSFKHFSWLRECPKES